VDLEHEKNKNVKYTQKKFKLSDYKPLSNRGVATQFDIHKTVVPESFRRHKDVDNGGLAITKDEILFNRRDVDSVMDKRLSQNQFAYHQWKHGVKPLKQNKICRKKVNQTL